MTRLYCFSRQTVCGRFGNLTAGERMLRSCQVDKQIDFTLSSERVLQVCRTVSGFSWDKKGPVDARPDIEM